MIIKYDEDNFEVICEEEISKVHYRIVKFDTGYYALQYYGKDTLSYIIDSSVNDWVTLLIYPNNNNVLLENGLGYIQNRGSFILGDILDDKKNTEKLKNGEYYEVKLYLDEDYKEDFKEIVARNEYDTLMGKLDAYYDLYRVKKLEAIEVDLERKAKQNTVYLIIGFIIMILCFIALMNLIRILLI